MTIPGYGENVFIGKVKYLNGGLLKEKIMDDSWLMTEAICYENQAASLMFKRLEFEHEKEVRLLYLDNFQRNQNADLFHYRIDPIDLFDEIVFDPRISDETFEVYKHYLVEKIGYFKMVQQSELYKIPIL